MDRQDHNTKEQGLLDDKDTYRLLSKDTTKEQGLLDDKDTYRPLSKDPTAKLKIQLINICKNCKAQGQINQVTIKRLYATSAIPPILWLIKSQQARNPRRPIVSSRGSVMYGVAKEMANIL